MGCKNFHYFLELINSDREFAEQVKATGDDAGKVISLAEQRNCRISRRDFEKISKICNGELNCYDPALAIQPDQCRCRMAGKLPFIHWER